MTISIVKEEKAIIEKIEGSDAFKSFLIANGFTKDTEFTFNYSPGYAGLINLTIRGKIICVRKTDFENIKWRATR